MARAKIEDQRKEEILTAFEACVIRDGLAKTTLKNVADEAGLPRSLVRYFVGNRDQMVTLLIDRMLERGEASFAALRSSGSSMTAKKLVDFLFDRAMGDETSNDVVGELWYLAQRDDDIRQRLAALYQMLADRLVEQMAALGITQSVKARTSVAYTIMSLAYGDSSFDFLNFKSVNRKAARAAAQALVDELCAQSQERKQG